MKSTTCNETLISSYKCLFYTGLFILCYISETNNYFSLEAPLNFLTYLRSCFIVHQSRANILFILNESYALDPKIGWVFLALFTNLYVADVDAAHFWIFCAVFPVEIDRVQYNVVAEFALLC